MFADVPPPPALGFARLAAGPSWCGSRSRTPRCRSGARTRAAARQVRASVHRRGPARWAATRPRHAGLPRRSGRGPRCTVQARRPACRCATRHSGPCRSPIHGLRRGRACADSVNGSSGLSRKRAMSSADCRRRSNRRGPRARRDHRGSGDAAASCIPDALAVERPPRRGRATGFMRATSSPLSAAPAS
jgi:hypothetical protein